MTTPNVGRSRKRRPALLVLGGAILLVAVGNWTGGWPLDSTPPAAVITQGPADPLPSVAPTGSDPAMEFPAPEIGAAATATDPPAEREPETITIEFPEAPEDEDPDLIRPFITEPEPSSLISQTDEAPRTGATDSTEQLVGGEVVEPPTVVAEARRVPMTPPPPPVFEAREFQGACPSGTSAANPVDWQQLSPAQRAAFPRPHLSVTATRGGPGRRFVMVGSQIVREGQPLPTGGVLMQLSAQRLVVSSGGCVVAFPLRVLIHGMRIEPRPPQP